MGNSDMDYFPLSVFGGAMQSVVGGMLLFLFTLWFASVTAAICGSPQLLSFQLLAEAYYIPLAWLVSVFVGIFQGWGLLSYGAIAVCALMMVQSETNRVHLLAAVFFIQFLETGRFLYRLEILTNPLLLIIVALMLAVAYPIGYIYAVRWMLRRYEQAQDGNVCQSCGYDLRASQGQCPECGEPISP